jgi:alpha-beta hydrolase superfamily lysophospholipase
VLDSIRKLARLPIPPTLPVLLQHGTEDRICDVRGSEAFTRSHTKGITLERTVPASSARSAADLSPPPSALYNQLPSSSPLLLKYLGAHHDLIRERPEWSSLVFEDMDLWLRRIP